MGKRTKRTKFWVINSPDIGTLPVDRDILRWHAVLLPSIGKAYVYRTHIFELLNRTTEQNRINALVYLHDAVFLRFLMDWCKVFGGIRNNHVHWTNLYTQVRVKEEKLLPKNKFYGLVRMYLIEKAQLDAQTFDGIVFSMTQARNRYAAHLDFRNLPKMPFLLPAYNIANSLSMLLKMQESVSISSLEDRAEFDKEEIETITSVV